MSGQIYAPAILNRVKCPRYVLYRGLGGPQVQPGHLILAGKQTTTCLLAQGLVSVFNRVLIEEWQQSTTRINRLISVSRRSLLWCIRWISKQYLHEIHAAKGQACCYQRMWSFELLVTNVTSSLPSCLFNGHVWTLRYWQFVCTVFRVSQFMLSQMTLK